MNVNTAAYTAATQITAAVDLLAGALRQAGEILDAASIRDLEAPRLAEQPFRQFARALLERLPCRPEDLPFASADDEMAREVALMWELAASSCAGEPPHV